MVLYTNRATAPGDPLMRFVGGLDDRLAPRALKPRDDSDTGQARAAWAEHLGIDGDALAAMLESLHIRAGEQSLRSLQERCQENMAMLGLKSDTAAIHAAIGALRGLIEEGRTSLDRAAVQGLVETMGLPTEPARATLLIQCLARDPWPDTATASVDWIDLFEGDSHQRVAISTTRQRGRRECVPSCEQRLQRFETGATNESLSPGRTGSRWRPSRVPRCLASPALRSLGASCARWWFSPHLG